ncbi:MAG: type I 3-dehydroquinate dehydratase [Candidatus Gracilibacteria bacterium]|nr:type I 3-dehydroquinate dehydratase [Candidatus Gracilibacteria bacterium]MDD5179340.1 type I 3-dehydroquinate dehydratase [Candidatus Gracilibacteria bacterium]
MPKIIIPLKPKNLAEAKKLISKAGKAADIIEVWLDGVEDLNQAKVAAIVKLTKKPVILNLKDKKEKGVFRGKDSERFALLTKSKAAYVDLPLSFPAKLIQQFRKENPQTKLILSFHDFTEMPSIQALRQLSKKAIQLKADVIKLVGFAKKFSDNLPILQISHELAETKKEFLTIAMGEKGEVTRSITPLLGGLGMFALLDAKNKTAAGQIPAKELRQLWEKFEE